MEGSAFFSSVMFWMFALIAVLPGLGILLARDIVRQAFWLLLSLVGFAGLYLHLGADFLGFTQVVVYIGGILILFLFGVMLTLRVDVPLKEVRGWALVVPGVLTGAVSAAALLFVAFKTPWNEAAKPASPTVSAIGSRILSTYILPFEVISVVLLVALIGATFIARRKESRLIPRNGGKTGETES